MRRVLLHGHIFKNAGTSLDWALQRSLGDAFLDHRDEAHMREQGASHLLRVIEGAPALRALSTHHLPSLDADVSGLELLPLFLLRHPLTRCLSVYSFERVQQADTRGAKAAKQMDLVGYLAWRLRDQVPNVIRSYQTAYLAGDHRPLIAENEMSALFALAQSRLSGLELVGTVERYDESMVLFEHLLKPVFPQLDLSYRIQNRSVAATPSGAGPTPAGAIEAMGSLASAVVDVNAYDLALHQLASRKLELAIARIDDFNHKLSEFKNRCNVLGL